MRKILTLLAFSTIFSTLALAANWSGALLDASCYDQQFQQLKDMQKAADACAATSQTTAFALHASNKVYKFDSTGNSKAITAMKSRADRTDPATPPSAAAPPSQTVTAKVEGTETPDSIKVESIEVQ